MGSSVAVSEKLSCSEFRHIDLIYSGSTLSSVKYDIYVEVLIDLQSPQLTELGFSPIQHQYNLCLNFLGLPPRSN